MVSQNYMVLHILLMISKYEGGSSPRSIIKFWFPEAKDKYKKRLSFTPLRYGLRLQQLHECVCPGGVYDYAHFADTDVQMTWEIFRYYKQHATVEELKWTEPSVEERVTNATEDPAQASNSKKARTD